MVVRVERAVPIVGVVVIDLMRCRSTIRESARRAIECDSETVVGKHVAPSGDLARPQALNRSNGHTTSIQLGALMQSAVAMDGCEVQRLPGTMPVPADRPCRAKACEAGGLFENRPQPVGKSWPIRRSRRETTTSSRWGAR